MTVKDQALGEEKSGHGTKVKKEKGERGPATCLNSLWGWGGYVKLVCCVCTCSARSFRSLPCHAIHTEAGLGYRQSTDDRAGGYGESRNSCCAEGIQLCG